MRLNKEYSSVIARQRFKARPKQSLFGDCFVVPQKYAGLLAKTVIFFPSAFYARNQVSDTGVRHLRSLFFLLTFLVLPSLCFAQTTVKGRVVFEGAPPAVEVVEVKSDVPTCGSIKEVQKILLGKDQGVANAVVKIIGALGALAPGKGTLDQANCDFVPHVQVLPAGSTLIITSSDPVLHNSHGFNEDGSTAFNIAVPIMGMEVSKKLEQAGTIKLRCDAGHTWMSAYVVVTDQPYYALTDADGNFTIEGVPPGNYQIEVWQEWLGKSRQPIVVKEGESKPTAVTLKPPSN